MPQAPWLQPIDGLRSAALLLGALACTPALERSAVSCAPPPAPATLLPVDTPFAAVYATGTPGRLEGQAVLGGGTPPVGVQVLVRLPANRFRGQITSPVGRFEIDSIPPGRYPTEVRRIGHQPWLDTLEFRADSGTHLVAYLPWSATTTCPVIYARRVRPWWHFW